MFVVVRGPLLSVTGYGSHTRQIWKWARSKGWKVQAQIVPWGTCTYYIDADAEDGVIGDVMENSGGWPEEIKPDLSIQVQLPDEWDPNLAKKNIGVTAGIEADKCNPSWIEACSRMDQVIVPSTYSKLSFINGGLAKDKIHNVPESYTCGFEETDNHKKMTERLDDLSTDFNFLIFGQMTGKHASTDRKNTLNMIKWICEEFKNDPRVGIVLKTNMGRMTCGDRQLTSATIKNILNHVRPGQLPRMHVLHGLMDKNEISALLTHDKIKVLCAATRGEGWGLPILDAAVSGLPIIATKHSGHMDFLQNMRFLDVDYKIVEIPEQMADGRIWVKGSRWAEPSEKHFKSRIRKFRNSSKVPKEWAQQAAPSMLERYSMSTISKRYDEVIGEIVDVS